MNIEVLEEYLSGIDSAEFKILHTTDSKVVLLADVAAYPEYVLNDIMSDDYIDLETIRFIDYQTWEIEVGLSDQFFNELTPLYFDKYQAEA